MTAPAPTKTAALEIEGLELAYMVRGIPREVLRGVNFRIEPGQAYGLVGESGCGKSTTAYAAVRYLPSNGRITAGSIKIGGDDVTAMSGRALRDLRSSKVSMVYQDPGSALNPTLKIGRQVVEAYEIVGNDRDTARKLAMEARDRVRIADPVRVMDRYPHQLSGGMQQRIVIAMGLAGDPELLILDEPTTGLDATVEAEVLDLVRALREEVNAAILLIDPAGAVVIAGYVGDLAEGGDRVRIDPCSTIPNTPTHSVCSSACPDTVFARKSVACSQSRGRCRRSAHRFRLVCSSTGVRSPTTSAVPRCRLRCPPGKATTRCVTTSID